MLEGAFRSHAAELGTHSLAEVDHIQVEEGAGHKDNRAVVVVGHMVLFLCLGCLGREDGPRPRRAPARKFDSNLQLKSDSSYPVADSQLTVGLPVSDNQDPGEHGPDQVPAGASLWCTSRR